MAVQLIRRRFTVAEYQQMAQAGILGEDDRVELIDGEIIEMTPIGRRQAGIVDRLFELMVLEFHSEANVRSQNPVDLGEYSEPQPDLTLLRRRPDFYASGIPTTADVYLIVEVADSSIVYDRRVKVPLYARSGIAEVWLVDVEQENVTVYRDPTADGHQTARVLRRGDKIAPAAFPNHELAVVDLLG